jgi:hypothetical protein
MKIDLEKMIGKFFPSNGETSFRTLDGSDVAAFLERNGEPCIGFFDTGRNGIALTVSGYSVSTNGYCHKSLQKHIDKLTKKEASK